MQQARYFREMKIEPPFLPPRRSGALLVFVLVMVAAVAAASAAGLVPATYLAQVPSPTEGDAETISAVEITLGLSAGLAIFLLGVDLLAKALRSVGEGKVKDILTRFTRTPFSALITGTLATAILDSSSVVIIMTIAMVSAGLLTFKQSLGIVLGANIGTTIGGQIVALDLLQYAPILLLLGVVVSFVSPSETWKRAGLVTAAAGMVFFGLEYIGGGMEPFEKYQPFINLMQAVATNPLQGVLLGAAVTAVIQSSSGTMAIVIMLATNGLIPLQAGIHIMLGAEIGTCLDTLVATLGRSRGAVRTGVFHLFFNLVTVTAGLAFASQLAAAGEWLAFGDDNVGRKIANAHVLFNTTGALLFLPLVPTCARLLKKWVLPKKGVETEPLPIPV